METLLIACDFDGTITQHDTLHLIVEEFGTRGLWETIEPRLRSGEVTLEEAMQEEFATVRATPEQVIELVLRDAGIRPGLRRAGAGGPGPPATASSSSPRASAPSSRRRSTTGASATSRSSATRPCSPPGAARLVWSDRGETCVECGRRCKRHDLRGRLRGERLVYIGDGISDRCGAGMADVVFARAHLARDLSEAGVAASSPSRTSSRCASGSRPP